MLMLSRQQLLQLDILCRHASLSLQPRGQLRLDIAYKPFEDDDVDAGYRDGEAFALLMQQRGITDVKVLSLLISSIAQQLPNFGT